MKSNSHATRMTRKHANGSATQATLTRRAKRNAAVAGASALTCGTLATLAIMARRPLGRLVQQAAEGAADLGGHLTLSNLLEIVGLQKRRSSMWAIGPALGGLVVGAAAPLAVTWLARRQAVDPPPLFDRESSPHAANSTREPTDTPIGLEGK